MQVRRSAERGRAEHGWLSSRHTFSFGEYHDPRFVGFGHLRVLNEDRVQPGRGFGTHGHRDMEILSYVVQGELAHRDTLGTGSTIRPGELQLMSAGTGVAHSEVNPSATDAVHFLQIWILPARTGTPPSYAQRDFGSSSGLRLMASPGGREGTLAIGQDADLWRALLPAGQTAALALRRSRCWVQVVRGTLALGGVSLEAGDGAALMHASALSLHPTTDVEALVFDLT